MKPSWTILRPTTGFPIIWHPLFVHFVAKLQNCKLELKCTTIFDAMTVVQS